MFGVDNLHYSCSFLDLCANKLTNLSRSRHLVYSDWKLSSTRFALRECVIERRYGVNTRVSVENDASQVCCAHAKCEGGSVYAVDIWKCGPDGKDNSAHI